MRLSILTLVLLAAACARESKPAAPAATAPAATPTAGARRIELTVTENGFEPSPITVKQGEPLDLVVTRKTDKTCATDIVIPEAGIKKALPMNEPVVVSFTPSKAGELKYGCAMDLMIAGVLLVE